MCVDAAGRCPLVRIEGSLIEGALGKGGAVRFKNGDGKNAFGVSWFGVRGVEKEAVGSHDWQEE